MTDTISVVLGGTDLSMRHRLFVDRHKATRSLHQIAKRLTPIHAMIEHQSWNCVAEADLAASESGFDLSLG
jgi:hypothetical protein